MCPTVKRCPFPRILLHLELHPTSRPSVTRASVNAGRLARLPLPISLCVPPLPSYLSWRQSMLKKHFHWIIGAFFVLALMSPAAHGKDWVLLGTAHVDGTIDHDTIHVSGSEGPFHKIQLRVNGGSVEV